MACGPKILKDVALFAQLDDDELAVLAAQVEITTFEARQRIYKIGDAGGRAYVLVSGRARISTIDDDNQDVGVGQPSGGDFFGFPSLLCGTPHQTNVGGV